MICDMKYDINTVYECENLILNKINWKINLSSAYEMSRMIIQEIVVESELTSSENINSFSETANDLISFSLNEYELFILKLIHSGFRLSFKTMSYDKCLLVLMFVNIKDLLICNDSLNEFKVKFD